MNEKRARKHLWIILKSEFSGGKLERACERVRALFEVYGSYEAVVGIVGPALYPTTAIYPNRMRDKEAIELRYRLSEVGKPLDIYTPSGNLFATGYRRVVYGDHGAYIELASEHIVMSLRSKFAGSGKPNRYYNWLLPTDGSGIKVYEQLRDVRHLRNAPRRADGKPSKFNRIEGYADYRIGMYYVCPTELRYS